MPDHYKTLGISKSASDDEIKSAYRKLARSHHPDKGGDKDAFQQIQEAYEVLSDNSKRRNYDSPQENLNNAFSFGFNHPFFRQTRTDKIKKNDYTYTCQISLNDVYTGILKKFRVQRNKICNNCKQSCNNCNGTGQIIQQVQIGPFTQTVQQTCQTCQGSGKISNKKTTCNICNNKETIHEEHVFEVDIKPGVESGTKITFEGWGEQAVRDNEVSGSFIVMITISDHPEFKRLGLNLIYNTSLSLRESIVGKTISIPHFKEPIMLDTRGFGVINPNKEYILYNKGLVNETGKQGNLYIRFSVDYKECNFDDDQIELLNKTFDTINFN